MKSTYFIMKNDTKIYTITQYDLKGRPVKVQSDNHLKGSETTTTSYTFTGKPLIVRHVHSIPGKQSYTETYQYTYDHSERLLRVAHQLGSNPPVVLSDNEYDELGRLKSNTHHYKPTLKTTYSYNIRNWLSVLSNPSFKQTLSYVGKYNGNVSSMSWGFSTSSTDPVYTYSYSYDDLDRLKTASYSVKNVNPVFIPGTSVVMPGTTPDYSEKVVSYDKQGNILRLQRCGRIGKVNAGSFITFKYGLVDDVTFSYHGNQLVGAGDSGKDPLDVGSFNFIDGNPGVDTGEYTYDFNGNLTADFNKEINSMGYNLLNMPSRIFFSGHRAIGYFHDIDGVKRRSVYQTPLSESISGVMLDESVTDYCGNFIYKDGTLSMILTSEGYITLKGSVPTYHYYLRDYMGNNRVVIDQYGTVEQRNNYYAFGGVFESSLFGSTDGVQPYKHGGKELDRMHGLDWYDLGLRPYDGASGRFPSSMDPLCEKYYPVSPYAYCMNNPVKYVDLKGDSISVAEGYRNQFNRILSTMFENYAVNFSYSSTGMLNYNGSTKGMSKDQKELMKGLSKVMNENTVTNIIYESQTTIMDNNGNEIAVKAADGGGAITILARENPNFNQNTILIDPSIQSQATVLSVTPAYYLLPINPVNGNRFESTIIEQGINDVTFHEIGHVIYQRKSQNKVIDYHNISRKRLSLGPRPYDEHHNKNVKKGVY